MSKIALFGLAFLSVIPLALLGFAYVQHRADRKRILAEQEFIRHVHEIRRKKKVRELQAMQANHDPFDEPPYAA